MSLLSITLYVFKAVAVTTGIVIVIGVGVGLFLIQGLNQILSVIEEDEVPEKINTDSFRRLSFSSTDYSESAL